jgi:peptidoglycan hydrolase-like protein with peptidoglycan-binding domain
VPRRRHDAQTDLERGLIVATLARHPRESVGLMLAAAATVAICVNALFLQSGPHPAPIFATRPFVKPHRAAVVLPRPQPAPAKPAGKIAPRSEAQIIADIQRELASRGFYQGAVDGIWGAQTEAATQEFTRAAQVKIVPAPTEAFVQAVANSHIKAGKPQSYAAPAAPSAAPAHTDAIAKLIDPSPRVLAIQHALADFGYGQIKPTGVVDADTRMAIDRFERDHQLPVDGEISARFVKSLATMTGRSLAQ